MWISEGDIHIKSMIMMWTTIKRNYHDDDDGDDGVVVEIDADVDDDDADADAG